MSRLDTSRQQVENLKDRLRGQTSKRKMPSEEELMDAYMRAVERADELGKRHRKMGESEGKREFIPSDSELMIKRPNRKRLYL